MTSPGLKIPHPEGLVQRGCRRAGQERTAPRTVTPSPGRITSGLLQVDFEEPSGRLADLAGQESGGGSERTRDCAGTAWPGAGTSGRRNADLALAPTGSSWPPVTGNTTRPFDAGRFYRDNRDAVLFEDLATAGCRATAVSPEEIGIGLAGAALMRTGLPPQRGKTKAGFRKGRRTLPGNRKTRRNQFRTPPGRNCFRPGVRSGTGFG